MESLPDPLKDRQVKNLKAPPHKPLDKLLLWPEKLKSAEKKYFFFVFFLFFLKMIIFNYFSYFR